MTLVLEGVVITPFQVFSPGYVSVEGSKIQHVGPIKPKKGETLSYEECYVCPGLIDVHTHGAMGHDVMDGRAETIHSLASFFPRFGVTAFLPTLSTSSQRQSVKVAKAVNEGRRKNDNCSTILGLHLEGPYINASMRGAQSPDHIRPPSVSEIQEVMASVPLMMVTLAPEVEQAHQLIRWLDSKGVAASAGHSSATYQQMLDGINAGIRHVTHLFNAMKGFHHREPGLIGAALFDQRISFDIIPDGVHLHRAAYELALKVKEPSRTVLASDSLPTTGLNDGAYDFCGMNILVEKGVASLESGVLAGSNITLNEGVKYVSELGTREVKDVIQMASYSPASLLNIQGQKGSLASGMDADIVVFDNNFEPKLTMIEGKIVYEEDE